MLAMAFLYSTDAGNGFKLKPAPVVSFSGLILTPDQFPGLVLCPSFKNAYAAMRREGSARLERAARGKEMMELGFFVNIYETSALRLQEFIFYFLDTVELYTH